MVIIESTSISVTEKNLNLQKRYVFLLSKIKMNIISVYQKVTIIFENIERNLQKNLKNVSKIDSEKVN